MNPFLPFHSVMAVSSFELDYHIFLIASIHVRRGLPLVFIAALITSDDPIISAKWCTWWFLFFMPKPS